MRKFGDLIDWFGFRYVVNLEEMFVTLGDKIAHHNITTPGRDMGDYNEVWVWINDMNEWLEMLTEYTDYYKSVDTRMYYSFDPITNRRSELYVSKYIKFRKEADCLAFILRFKVV